MRPNYLHVAASNPQALLALLRGCVETPADLSDSGSPLVQQTLLRLNHSNDNLLTNGSLRPIANQ